MPKTHFLPGSPRGLEHFSPSTGPRPSACTKTTSPSVQRGPCTVPPAHVGIRRGRAARSTGALTSTCQRDWRLRRSEFLGPHRFQSGGGSCGPAIQFEGAALCKFARPLGRAVSCSLFPRACGSASQMDKVCAVFGGSRGIGRAVARLMAQRGYRLAIVARNLEGARAAAGDLGGDHLALSCDVAKEHDVQNTFEEIEKNLGQVNFLVNAAGINRDNLLVRTNAEEMLSQLHTNLLGSMLTCRAAVRMMIKQQSGSIVNVGSVVGLKGNSGQSVYSATKGGLVGFSRALAKEVAKKKIRVNVVAPGFIHTDMTKDLNEEHLKKNIPLGRFGDALDVAQAVVFLLESPYVTGHVLVVDGGLQLTM